MSRLDSSARVRANIGPILAEGPIGFDHLCIELEDRELELGPDPQGGIDDVRADEAYERRVFGGNRQGGSGSIVLFSPCGDS